MKSANITEAIFWKFSWFHEAILPVGFFAHIQQI